MTPGKAAYVCIGIACLLGGCADDPIKIPFRYERNIYLRTLLDGRNEASLMFDTGAYNLYLDSFYQKSAGIAPFIYSDALGNITTRHLHMAVGTLSFSPEETYVINTRPTFGRQCDGIVGWNIFGDHVIAI